jgi:hypothetical protein
MNDDDDNGGSGDRQRGDNNANTTIIRNSNKNAALCNKNIGLQDHAKIIFALATKYHGMYIIIYCVKCQLPQIFRSPTFPGPPIPPTHPIPLRTPESLFQETKCHAAQSSQ